jgi:hypothetical protein
VVAAKVCTSETGRVTSATLITKIDPRAARDIVQALYTWQYAPYQHHGVATPVCFAVSFRIQ